MKRQTRSRRQGRESVIGIVSTCDKSGMQTLYPYAHPPYFLSSRADAGSDARNHPVRQLYFLIIMILFILTRVDCIYSDYLYKQSLCFGIPGVRAIYGYGPYM